LNKTKINLLLMNHNSIINYIQLVGHPPERISVGSFFKKGFNFLLEGFDFGNSPSQILNADPTTLAERTVLQRTSSGVQGALAALKTAEEVLLGSYGIARARATADYISARRPREVSLVALGWDLKEIAPEDEGCARYIAYLLGSGTYNHVQSLRGIVFHESTQKFLRGDTAYFPPEDPILCLQRDIFDFVLRARHAADLVRVEKID